MEVWLETTLVIHSLFCYDNPLFVNEVNAIFILSLIQFEPV